MTTTNPTSAPLLALAEDIREAQFRTNNFDSLAGTDSAWGHLKNALLETLTAYFRSVDAGDLAPALAELILNECYDNGENLTYQIKLLADGIISL